ncbi:hypothetical protein ACHAWX_000154 [Stephanocyclus meneghinianus]
MPPVGNPEHGKGNYWLLNKTLYELRHSPHHWYNMFCAALKDIGLEQSVHVPCLFSGNLTSDTSPTSKSKLHVGIYVDNFLFYSEDPAAEKAFQQQLAKKVVVDQSAFTEFTAHQFAVDRFNRTPHMTPYRSGYPIDSIPPADPKDPDLKRRTKVYLYCWQHQLAGNKHSSRCCSSSFIFGFLQPCTISSTLQVSITCAEIPIQHSQLWHLFSLRCKQHNSSI